MVNSALDPQTGASSLPEDANEGWDILPVAIWKLSAEGIILKVSRAGEMLLGYAAGEFTNRPLDDFLVDSIDFEFLKKRIKLLGRVSAQEACLRCKDGSTRHVVIDAGPIDAGQPGSAIYCSVSDFSIRKRTEDHAREQAQFFARSDEAVIILNLEGLVIYWSPGAERLYGLPAGKILGNQLPQELNADHFDLSKVLEKTIKAGEWVSSMRQFNSAGMELEIESRWLLLKDGRGRPQSILVINEDTAQSRTFDEQRLRAQRQECIGTLAGGIAHDLNNILQPLSIAVDLFRNRLPDSDSQDLLGMVDSNLRRATELVRQILSFTSGERGERRAVEVASLFSEVASFVRQTFPKTIMLELSVAEGLHPILADSTQMEQVLLNLCVNARDAMADGGRLQLEALNYAVDEGLAARQPQAKPGNYVRLSVKDSGQGIPRKLRKKIFEPFFTTKGPDKGTGLGLATALGIIRSHSGFLTLETEEGCGTSFHIFIPVADQAPALAPKASVTAPEGRLEGGGESILLVDDEVTVLKVMQRSLEKSGYRVLTAEDGEKGFEVYTKHEREINLVITDMAMPGMDGPGLIAALKKLNPEIPVICTSGLNNSIGNDALIEMGVQRILYKPCNSQTILQAIKDALRVSQIQGN
jgi:PAS domain S-box-containing protein